VLEWVEETGSTNADVLARYTDATAPIRTRLSTLPDGSGWAEAQAAFPPIVRVTERQSAGRGRRGKSWWSAPGSSLLFSVGAVLPMPVGALSGLSLAVGTAVIDGLRDLGLIDPARLALKWPNDLLLDEAKLGGILIETAATAPHAVALVIGIGINLSDTPAIPVVAGAPASGALPATSLMAAVDKPTRSTQSTAHPAGLQSDALALLIPALAAMFETFTRQGFGGFRQRWWDMHRFAGREVSILESGQEQLRGTAADVDEWGRLLIDTGDNGAGQRRLQAIVAGDVSLRPVRHAAQATDDPGITPAVPSGTP
jgi:BirA family biotin operon repressor/biotin-[acetyl-CoA-carboxylase] ligase